MTGQKRCCSCGKESLIFPYVCADCLSVIKKAQQNNETIRGMLDKAEQILRAKGYEEEANSIESMMGLIGKPVNT
jgi:hypothetical protein